MRARLVLAVLSAWGARSTAMWAVAAEELTAPYMAVDRIQVALLARALAVLLRGDESSR